LVKKKSITATATTTSGTTSNNSSSSSPIPTTIPIYAPLGALELRVPESIESVDPSLFDADGAEEEERKKQIERLERIEKEEKLKREDKKKKEKEEQEEKERERQFQEEELKRAALIKNVSAVTAEQISASFSTQLNSNSQGGGTTKGDDLDDLFSFAPTASAAPAPGGVGFDFASYIQQNSSNTSGKSGGSLFD